MTTPNLRNHRKQRCHECGRVFDLFDTTDADEWIYGHDCEVTALPV